MIKRLFIETTDVMVLNDCNYKRAYRELRAVKDALDKKKHQKITFKEYADYYGVDENEVRAGAEYKKNTIEL